MSKITDIERWRAEISLAKKHQKDEFGEFTNKERVLAGKNIDYFERGFSYDSIGNTDVTEEWLTTLNIIDSITSIVVPSLYFRNPKTVVVPQKVESEDSAPVVAKILDHYRKILDIAEVNKRIIWDTYVLGYGVYKVGYATKFGTDIEDEVAQKAKDKKKKVSDALLESIGLKKKKPKEEPKQVDIDLNIIAENPFIEYVSPFDFLMDPRALKINDAMWVAQRVRKSVADMKRNPKYKNTTNLQGIPSDEATLNLTNMPTTAIEEFETVDIMEIHYRNNDKFYLLVLSIDGSNEWRSHYHEESIYDMNEYQFDILTFKKNSHVQYPRSDITKIKNLQDRLSSTIDAILEQVDKFVPKLAYSTGDLTEQGKSALELGSIGALVECNKNPKEVFEQLNFTQLKADLAALVDQLINLISIQTGVTRAQISGVSSANTATEATIEQGGQNLRLSNMSSAVQRFVNIQSRKLWKVIKQFVELEELQLINGVRGINENDGTPQYNWLLIPSELSEKMQEGEYDFDIEIGSTQKVNQGEQRKAFENMFSILARTEVVGIIQQQGSKVNLSEILKKYMDLFPEMGIDSSKVIQPITNNTSGLITPEQQGPGGTTQGSNFNALEAQAAAPPPAPGQSGEAL